MKKSYWISTDQYEYYFHKCQKYARKCTDVNHVQSLKSMFCRKHDQIGLTEDTRNQTDHGAEKNTVVHEDYSDGEIDFETEIRIKILVMSVSENQMLSILKQKEDNF